MTRRMTFDSSWACRVTMSLFVLVSVLAGSSLGRVQSAPPSTPPRWEDRLESLDPDRVIEYFLLAEDIADYADSDAKARDQARQLFALSAALDSDRLGRSACLALADLEPDERAKRRYRALADLLRSDEFVLGVSLAGDSQSSPGESVVLAACEALSRYRRGLGPQALTALKEPGSTELLQRYEEFVPGGVARFLEDCKTYRGQSRPLLTESQIIRMLQLESALLAGREITWSGEMMTTGGQPFIEVDPAYLAESLGVDADRPLYRHGRWVEESGF